jgi:hypothetical protein
MKISYDKSLRNMATTLQKTLFTMAIEQTKPGGVFHKTQGIADEQLEQDLLTAVQRFNERRTTGTTSGN